MFKTLAGYLGDILSGSIKDERIQLSREQSEDLRLKLADLVAEANRLRSENYLLITDNGDLARRVKKLEAELDGLRKTSQPGSFVEHMGALWRRTKEGFEPLPYCKHCNGNPICMDLKGFTFTFVDRARIRHR